jgi:lysophospholipase L1-like esterase
VFYAGDNDLAAGKKPDQIIATWKELMTRITSALPETKVIYLSLRPSVKRQALLGEQQKVNAGIKTLIEGQKNIQFVDLSPALLGSDGKARADLLVKDMLHLNDEGYKVLTGIVKPLLK